MDLIQFSVALAPGGTPVDFAEVAMTYSDATNLVTLQQTLGTYPVNIHPDIGYWNVISIQNDDGSLNKLLSAGEQFTIMARPIAGGIAVNKKFTIEVKPSIGAAFGITRCTPGGLDAVNILY